ncbi:DUF4185 domain-containing protein [Luteipulveratus mongoliensis]|uniref:DUF4185 domain-containing protein n=1 Tax=Luteipulveratus mongoliensis TaxID=571913 RepID=A0A0K1JK38_9MICO|nr:DUF4185 domain-containing protein [Luteipulveratus mongoliensis]AKU16948.1 hypothetical protein VV02_15585 [Luteipulveratus mongoliensis]
MVSKRYRRRVLEPVAAVGIVAVILIAHAPSGPNPLIRLPHRSSTTSDASEEDASWPRLEPACAPETAGAAPAKVTVAELNQLVDHLDLPYWQAADIGASGRLSDNRLVLAFGDTLRKPDVAPNLVANSLIVATGQCASQVMVRDHGAVIPDRQDGVVYWPTSLVVLPGSGSDQVLVFTSRIRRTGKGGFAFTYLGASATRFTVQPGGAPVPQEQIDITPDSADETQVNWGGAAMAAKSWLYVYGTGRATAGPGRSLYVARAPLSNPEDRSQWRFWDGDSWDRSPDKVEQILPSDGVSQTLSADYLGGRYVLVSKRGGDFGDEVYAWSSSSPVGPWRRSKGVRAEFRDPAGGFRYAPLAHPEVPLQSGKLLVSISRNTDDLGKLLRDPRVGRPYLAEIAWPR